MVVARGDDTATPSIRRMHSVILLLSLVILQPLRWIVDLTFFAMASRKLGRGRKRRTALVLLKVVTWMTLINIILLCRAIMGIKAVRMIRMRSRDDIVLPKLPFGGCFISPIGWRWILMSRHLILC